MSKVLSYGPNGTPVDGLASITLSTTPLNYAADFGIVEETTGKIVYDDKTSAQDQPSTLRYSQQAVPNVYAGTSIDPSAFLPNRKGTATVIELKEVWSITDSTDPSFLQLMPFRGAIQLTIPTNALVTPDVIERCVGRMVAALFAQGDATMDDGVVSLQHGILRR